MASRTFTAKLSLFSLFSLLLALIWAAYGAQESMAATSVTFPDLYEASISELQEGLEKGDFTSVDLVKVRSLYVRSRRVEVLSSRRRTSRGSKKSTCKVRLCVRSSRPTPARWRKPQSSTARGSSSGLVDRCTAYPSLSRTISLLWPLKVGVPDVMLLRRLTRVPLQV